MEELALFFVDDVNINVIGAVAEFGHPLFDEDLLPLQREEVVRNQDYFETIIPLYSNQQFREHFRMSRETFNVC